jgi:pantothenate kinase type III
MGLDIMLYLMYANELAKTENISTFGVISFGSYFVASCVSNKSIKGVSIAPGFHFDEAAFIENPELMNFKLDNLDSIGFGLTTDEAIKTGYVHYVCGYITNVLEAMGEIDIKNKVFITGNGFRVVNHPQYVQEMVLRSMIHFKFEDLT